RVYFATCQILHPGGKMEIAKMNVCLHIADRQLFYRKAVRSCWRYHASYAKDAGFCEIPIHITVQQNGQRMGNVEIRHLDGQRVNGCAAGRDRCAVGCESNALQFGAHILPFIVPLKVFYAYSAQLVCHGTPRQVCNIPRVGIQRRKRQVLAFGFIIEVDVPEGECFDPYGSLVSGRPCAGEGGEKTGEVAGHVDCRITDGNRVGAEFPSREKLEQAKVLKGDFLTSDEPLARSAREAHIREGDIFVAFKQHGVAGEPHVVVEVDIRLGQVHLKIAEENISGIREHFYMMEADVHVGNLRSDRILVEHEDHLKGSIADQGGVQSDFAKCLSQYRR